jgi:plastocyanin
MRRRTYLGAVVGTVAGLSGCLTGLGTGGAQCTEGCNIGMSTNAFKPQRYETTVGSVVSWKNTSSRAHTVTAYEGSIPEGAEFFASGGYESTQEARDAWNSDLGGGIDPGGTFEHTFEVPGEYGYFCIPHERQGMVGTVLVREE